MSVWALIFWAAAVLLFYHLIGYPLLLAVLPAVVNRRVRKQDIAPAVSVIVPAHNEGGVIRAKLASVLDSRYPAHRLEVIVVEDGSTDDTAEQVRAVVDPRVILDRSPERSGKVAALNRAVRRARGEVLVFSDANALLRPDALAHLVGYLADPQVGCVTGHKMLAGRGTDLEASENAYWRFESWLKTRETRLGSTPAAVGELLAVRRELYDLAAESVINDDFQIVLRTVEQGYRAVYAPEAVTVEAGGGSLAEEMGRKSRMAAGRWQVVGRVLRLAPRRPLFVLEFVSHKGLRLLVLPLLIGVLAGSLGAVLTAPAGVGGWQALWRLAAPWGALALAAQGAFYALAGLGAVLERRGRRCRPLHLMCYFLSAQLASAAGLLRFVTGRQSVLWQKVTR